MIEENELPRAATVSTAPAPARARVVGGLLLLWFGWGSVYAAMAAASETIPPLLATGARFILAGVVLGAIGGARRFRPSIATGREWRSAVVLGALCILIGTGGVVVAIGHVASGTVAVLAATAPLWVAVVERVWLGRRVPRRAVVGLIIGFAGTALLVTEGGSASVDLGWGLVVILCSGGWALGMVYASVAEQATSPSLATGMQMIAGGAMVLLLAVVVGEPGDLDPGAISLRSAVGWGWMLVMGAFVGYGVCMWLLRVVQPTLVATASYINPIVAVLLGWALLDERITGRTLVSTGLVLVGVVVIVSRASPLVEPAER